METFPDTFRKYPQCCPNFFWNMNSIKRSFLKDFLNTFSKFCPVLVKFILPPKNIVWTCDVAGNPFTNFTQSFCKKEIKVKLALKQTSTLSDILIPFLVIFYYAVKPFPCGDLAGISEHRLLHHAKHFVSFNFCCFFFVSFFFSFRSSSSSPRTAILLLIEFKDFFFKALPLGYSEP